MEYCSLEEAFPTIKNGSVHSPSPRPGCKDDYSSKEERRAAKRKAKKCRGPPLSYLEETPDPDRPAVKRMDSVLSTEEEKEDFAMPVLPKASCLFSDAGTPAYFGKGEDDVDEGFSAFTNIIGDDPNYRLSPDVSKTFSLKGVELAQGSPVLPIPNVSDVWKPITDTGSNTAFFSSLPYPGGTIPKQRGADLVYKKAQDEDAELPGATAAEESETDPKRDVLLRRIEELQGRLELLETSRRKNAQAELLVFVGTGLALLVALHGIRRR
jgi:hypothetical protein